MNHTIQSSRESAAEVKTDSGPVVTCLANVALQKVEWLWRQRLAVGKAILWVGAPGDGKGMVPADITARITTGEVMPDGATGVRGDVLYIASEDGLADVLGPRLKAAGADLSRVRHVQAPM